MAKIEEVEGIGPVYGQKLADAGISTTDDLLERGGKPGGRQAIESATGIDHALILEWVNHVDLMRINGVDSAAELANRNVANLATTIQEVVAARPSIVRRAPGESEIAGWIAQAKDLPKVVEH
jgi:hypothetical protein